MMVRLGNFLFHYRNMLFPVFYALLFVPSPDIFDSDTTAFAAGFAVALAGQSIRVLTIGLKYIIRGGSKRRVYARDLVTTGIFAHCRNPLYVGNILVIAGLGLIANSLLFMAAVLPFFLVAYQAIVMAEEDFLRGKFGDAYRAYEHDVNRWIPSLTGLGDTLGSMSFNWRRVVIREYNATYIWLVGTALLVMRNLHGGDAFDTAFPVLAGVIVVLTVLYLTVRYLKKSKRLRDS